MIWLLLIESYLYFTSILGSSDSNILPFALISREFLNNLLAVLWGFFVNFYDMLFSPFFPRKLSLACAHFDDCKMTTLKKF